MRTSGTSALKPDGRYSIADYKSWTDDVRRELIDGVIYEMSPAPRTGHQELVLELAHQLKNFLDGKKCRPFIAPVDVYLLSGQTDDESYDVVQPDLIVVCDKKKVHDDGIHDAPDWVAEILSSSTTHRDLGEKRDLYERAGVLEYWLLNPDNGTVLAWRREGCGFASINEYPEGSMVASTVLPGFTWTAIKAQRFDR
jgi:Uma2 family endonuclease